ncbi:CD225/dispanin family protein [Corynebacterium freiburgense]|uniref:CD225/dispanin family protein n=1 Tax=Corynebacterium freiburgense TaxID=556548 RepID=UPI000408B73A|nr:CD225/dispanin family protein [Corynebacterium freiburgense]WJZ03948.1 Interferon-induced transmembrane protein [Corynebacterium freiburgense]
MTNPFASDAAATGGQKPDNYLILTILSTIFCCLPIGAYSIYLSLQVDKLWQAGQYADAAQASENAKKFAIISAVVGIIVMVLYWVLSIFVFAGSAAVDTMEVE